VTSQKQAREEAHAQTEGDTTLLTQLRLRSRTHVFDCSSVRAEHNSTSALASSSLFSLSLLGAGSMSTEQPRKVSADLRSAIEDDALHKARGCCAAPTNADATHLRWHQARDAAKFKAVGQRVDYETFKNMARRTVQSARTLIACCELTRSQRLL